MKNPPIRIKLRTNPRRASTKKLNEFLDIVKHSLSDEDENSDTKEEQQNSSKKSPRTKTKSKNQYGCKKCAKMFTTRIQLDRHKKKDDCEFIIALPIKETSAKKKQTDCKILKQDKMKSEYKVIVTTTEDGEKLYHCKKCPMKFNMLKDLKQHRKEHVPKEFIETHTFYFDDAQELYICNTCSAEFKDKEEVERHTKAHGENFGCSLCEEKFQTLFQLGSHLKITHSDDDQFSCPLCPDLKFPKPSLFMKHIDMKHQKRYMYTCKECGKGFHSKTLCREHGNVHLGVKPFACIVCGTSFTYSKSVTTHQLKAHRVEILGKSHATECSFCRNRFVSIASLDRHIQQVHSTPKAPKEKIHLCDICGMGFAKKNKMVVHQRVHTGVKPYPCRHCPKSFSKSGERNCHERIHTGERPYSCEYCGKAFRQTAPFKVHIRTHTGERPYVCDICVKGFTTNQGLKLHRKNCGNLDLKAF